MIVYGNVWDYLLSAIWVCLTFGIGYSVTYHRLLSHKAFNPPKWFPYVGSTLGALGMIGPPLAAVANHREHHRYSDTEKDIHILEGSKNTTFNRLFLRLFLERDVNLIYVKDLLRDKFQMFLVNHYFKVNMAYVALLLLISPKLVLTMYLFPGAITALLTSLGTVMTHWPIGYQNHDTKDKSTNHWFLMWFGFGEGLHNNHHAHPTRCNYAEKAGEFDIGYFVCRLLDKNAK